MKRALFSEITALLAAGISCRAPEQLHINTNKDCDERSSYHTDQGVLQYVNPRVGTNGPSPNDNGGMIPSVSIPFGKTRWTPQTRENFISQVPYHDTDTFVHGFQATHQPAIWMGESGQMILVPGWSDEVKPLFEERGLSFQKSDEVSTPYVYEVLLNADTSGTHNHDLTEQAAKEGPVPGGAGSVPDDVYQGANGRIRKRTAMTQYGSRNSLRTIRAAMSATAHAGYLRLDYEGAQHQKTPSPYVFIQASRWKWAGQIQIDQAKHEISGSNPQRQDYLLGPDRPDSFRGYFVSRFSEPFESYGTTSAGNISEQLMNATGNHVGAYVKFSPNTKRVEVRTGISFVSIDQARRNLDLAIPDGTRFETIIDQAKSAWLEKLGRVTIEGANKTDAEHDQKTIWYTALFHALQYPNDVSEPTSNQPGSGRVFYNGYKDRIESTNESYYQSWSIWDTYRAEHSLLTLFAPERINSMMRTLLKIFDWTGRLPIWANMVETNIMIATNADAVLANAISRGFRGFDIQKAWRAVQKDAYVPPDNDTATLYYDREPGTSYEARAGLTHYLRHGWVANDRWSESASRTLDYAFDDAACAIVARAAGEITAARELEHRACNYQYLWNKETQFMQARNANGSWANDSWGWTEGDKWVYTFDVMHDTLGLASLFHNGSSGMKAKLDEHFDGGHNMHSNEPSHHVPYMYSLLGHSASTADRVRNIAWHNYNTTSSGLSGNEDLGQMSAWYIFSAMGFYPLDPAGDEYVVGSPFFEKMTLRLPAGVSTGGGGGDGGKYGSNGSMAEERTLTISAPGAPKKPYVKSFKVDGVVADGPVISHKDLVTAHLIEFEMSREVTSLATSGVGRFSADD